MVSDTGQPLIDRDVGDFHGFGRRLPTDSFGRLSGSVDANKGRPLQINSSPPTCLNRVSRCSWFKPRTGSAFWDRLYFFFVVGYLNIFLVLLSLGANGDRYNSTEGLLAAAKSDFSSSFRANQTKRGSDCSSTTITDTNRVLSVLESQILGIT